MPDRTVEFHRGGKGAWTSLADLVREFRSRTVHMALLEHSWNIHATARALRCSRMTIYRMIERGELPLPGTYRWPAYRSGRLRPQQVPFSDLPASTLADTGVRDATRNPT